MPSPNEQTKKTHSVKSHNNAPSILSHDLVITGDVITDGDMQIEGRLEGNIKATTLTIGEQGAVSGTIKASVVNIHGKATGKITATTIQIHATANVTADLVQDNLSIENGAFFDGKCARKTKAPVSKPADTTPPKPRKS